jgi:glycosyltransferase involved in cell wall biosynthesis
VGGRARESSQRTGLRGPASVALGRTTVHVVLPDGVDDPARPSGGNRYDRRLCRELAATGWDVRELVVHGSWPRPEARALSELARTVAALPDGAVVLVDGLIASAAGSVLVPESDRVRLVVLVHMPFGDVAVPARAESAVLRHARAVVTTSSWTRDRLLDRYGLPPDRVRVARPGADPGELAPGTSGGGRLLCVGAVVPAKGHDVLLEALGGLADRPWHCTVVGSLDRDPGFVAGLRRRAADRGIADRITFAGPRGGPALTDGYRRADLLVHASRLESYGMVVTEALSFGLPVVATDVGGVPEALGRTAAGPPGLLVPPDDPAALGEALGAWLGDPGLRERLRRTARERRGSLAGWDATARQMAVALAAVGGTVGDAVIDTRAETVGRAP